MVDITLAITAAIGAIVSITTLVFKQLNKRSNGKPINDKLLLGISIIFGIIAILSIVSLGVIAVSSITPQPAPTPNVTPTPTVTITEGPTPTNTPTTIPTPISTPTPTSMPSPTPVISVKITSPHAGDGVDLVKTIEGTSQNVPSNQRIWIIIRSGERYYPMNYAPIVQINGQWSGTAYFGGAADTGKSFEILTILANQTAQDSINAYITQSNITGNYAGWPSLPAGVQAYDSVTVIRNAVPYATITSPVNSATVSKTEIVQGTQQFIPTDQVIWVVIYIPKVQFYYPMPSPVTMGSDGIGWSSVTTFGGPDDIGNEFDILAVAANQAVQSEFNKYNMDAKNNNDTYPGLHSLPTGTIEMCRAVVTRGPWT